jgi:hypothetical protein
LTNTACRKISKEITLALVPNDAARTFGYGEFALRFRVTVGSHLQMELEVHNYGKEPFIYREALPSLVPSSAHSVVRAKP